MYLSVSFDSNYIHDKNGNPIAYVPVPLDAIVYYDADGDGCSRYQLKDGVTMWAAVMQ